MTDSQPPSYRPSDVAECPPRASRTPSGDRILLDEEVRASFRSDFGRMVDRLPGAVARCTSAEEVAEVVRFCRERRSRSSPAARATPRAASPPPTAACCSTPPSMSTIHEIDEAGETATVDAGVVWRDLVEATCAQGLVPRVLTNNLGVAISGTLSMAGLGVASFRYGTQADNAVELQVVTGTGEIVTCSREENRELFDVVRCGLGAVRHHHPRQGPPAAAASRSVRKYYLLYDDLGALMEDASKVMDPENPTFSSLESLVHALLPGHQEDRRGHGARRRGADLRLLDVSRST